MAKGKGARAFGGSGSGWLLWLGIATLILGSFQYGESLPINGFFNLVRVHNLGAAFSFLSDAGGWQRWFFTGLGTVAALVMVWLLRSHASQRLFCAAVSCILGGAVGNVIDRLLHGYVVDCAITLGAALLVLDELLRVRRGR
jgi:signal peptidase II